MSEQKKLSPKEARELALQGAKEYDKKWEEYRESLKQEAAREFEWILSVADSWRQCQFCKWWETEHIEDFLWPLMVEQASLHGRGLCLRGMSYCGTAMDTGSKAFALDDEGWRAALVTNADFGCNQFESKQQSDFT